MDEDGHLAQVYVSEGVRPCRYRLQLAKDCFYGASSPKIPDITMLRSGHRICYTVNMMCDTVVFHCICSVGEGQNGRRRPVDGRDRIYNIPNYKSTGWTRCFTRTRFRVYPLE